MTAPDTKFFHQLYAEKSQRMAFKKTDFADYVIMALMCMLLCCLAYGVRHPMAILGVVLSALMIAAFPIRHGWKLALPMILKRPQDILFMFVYKLRNLKWMYVLALSLLLLENYLIALTPTWPHRTELVRTIGLYLFYFHFIGLSIYRTYIFYVHLRRQGVIREVLMQTVWKRKLEEQPNLVIEICHAYFTGLLSHILLIAPWFIVISHFKFSILFLALACVINFFTQVQFLKVINAWFYRDHWVSHQSEFEFVYLHGSHHDAIPSGLIGVAGNGHLEGFLRHSVGAPAPFFTPLMSALVYSFEVQGDIEAHQFIPGLYPPANIEYQKLTQHSMHHFGRLTPYSFGLNVDLPGVNKDFAAKFKILPDELKNSIKLDEALEGYEWANERHEKYLELVAKYDK